jgi:hypothetical protein
MSSKESLEDCLKSLEEVLNIIELSKNPLLFRDDDSSSDDTN